ncbi:prolyl oligopeptidase family protein, partial [Candidatus Neomarinimicrobiota bacterium]
QWMINGDAPETKTWVAAENSITRDYLDAVTSRDSIVTRLTELWNYERYGIPEKHGDYYFFASNNGLQSQDIIVRAKDLDGDFETVIDPNTLSEDGTAALNSTIYSKHGRYLVYGISYSGSDWQELHIRDLTAKADLPEVLKWTKFTWAGWVADATGFYYNRLPDPANSKTAEGSQIMSIYWHALNTPQSEDTLVFERTEPGLLLIPSISEDGRYLIINTYMGSDDRNGLYIKDTYSEESAYKNVFAVGEAEYEVIGNVGPEFYFRTNFAAPTGRIVAMNIEDQDQKNWREVVGQQADVLSGAVMSKGQLVAQYMHNATDQLRAISLDGSESAIIPVPGIGAVPEIWGSIDQDELFFSYTDFMHPEAIYSYDFSTGETEPVHNANLAFKPDEYTTTQVFYPSKDGTSISMYLTYRKDIDIDGQRPVLLHGYGGFDIAYLPEFKTPRLLFMEAGGIYAVVNLRGGSEYGENWHIAGMLENKQNVFDDFIAAGEWLIEQGYTSKKRLGIYGRSNGGLLTAACLLQRPDLFGAVVSQVPVTDMLHYHQWTVGRYWTFEYGNAEENPDHFKFMFAYSPVHNVVAGTTYPPTLITTAESDDRVVPVHSKKFAAVLQAGDAGVNPILLRVEMSAGHAGGGKGKPIAKQIEEEADINAFLFHNLKIEY